MSMRLAGKTLALGAISKVADETKAGIVKKTACRNFYRPLIVSSLNYFVLY